MAVPHIVAVTIHAAASRRPIYTYIYIYAFEIISICSHISTYAYNISRGSVPCKPPKPQNSLLSQRPLGEEGLKQLLDGYPHLKAEFQGYSGVGDLEFKDWVSELTVWVRPMVHGLGDEIS